MTHPTDRWLALCRTCVSDIEGVLETLPTRAEREPVLRAGMGGDDTTAIDAAAEAAVVARLEELGGDFILVSEELGQMTFGAGGPVHVVVDPIDGSVNAKRGSRSSPSRSRSPTGRRWATSSSGSSTTSARERSGWPSEGGGRD